MTTKFSNKELYFPILVLAILLIFKLIQFSKIISYFPLHTLWDAPDHISKLYFLAEYGFHGLVPNWYNGFILFQNYTPGYYYFSLPVYLLTNNLLLTTYLILILSFILGFIGILIFCKLQKISFIKSMAFFLFFFANPIFIGNFAKIARFASTFTWLVIFIPFCIVIFWYKDHKIDFKFILFILFLSSLILTHTFVLVPSAILIISLFLIKNKYEKILILLSTLFSLIITSFWWLPFAKISLSWNRQLSYLANEILLLESFISYNTLILFIFWFTLYFYLKDKNKFREKLFFLPPLVLSILFFSRLIVFIPLFNRVPPSPYNIFFLFLSIFLFLKTNYHIYPPIIKKLIPLALIILTIGSIIIVIFQMGTLPLEYNETEKEVISIFPQIHDKFVIFDKSKFLSLNSLAAYGSIYYNLSTPSGHHPPAAKKGVYDDLNELNKHFENKNCDAILLGLKKLNVKEIISIDEYCDFLISCNLNQKIRKQYICLLSLE